jgi:hypothetical protein
MSIKLILKERKHPNDVVNRWINDYAKDLYGRWPENYNRLATWAEKVVSYPVGSPEFQASLEAASNEFLRQTTFDLVSDQTHQSFAYGVEIASLGEESISTPPKESAIRDAMARNTYVDRKAMDFARAYNYIEVVTKDAERLAAFQTRLLQALEKGEHPSKAARDMAQDEEGDFSDWMRLARTETARSLQSGLFDESDRIGADYLFIFPTSMSCPNCARLIEDRVFRKSDLEGASNFKKKQSEWIAAVPLHPNCTHVAIPASEWTVAEAKKVSGGKIPKEGVKIKFVQPSER